VNSGNTLAVALAIEVPGLGALNVGGNAGIRGGLSCVSAGNCVAGGFYTDASRVNQHAFLVQEVNGRWQNAFQVPGFASLGPAGPDGGTSGISCRSAGDCSAGGAYDSTKGSALPFVVNEVNGVWGNAIEVPGMASLGAGQSGGVAGLSCVSAGNCEATGGYGNHGFAASEVNGVWQNAVEVAGSLPGTFPYNISCSSAGNCDVSGIYSPSGGLGVFVASEVKGVWHNAIEVPGLAALNTGNYASLVTMSCFSAGNCVLSGTYTNNSDKHAPIFVASEVNGTWHNAVQMPGDADLSSLAILGSGACASATNCSFGVSDGASIQTYTIDEVNGAWHAPAQIPGLAALNVGGGSSADAMACASAGNCGVIGEYTTSSSATQVYVDSES
jgi:hypothetical protein